MEAALKAFYDADPEFAQFVDRYGYAEASLQEALKEYRYWHIEMITASADRARALAASKAEGIAERDIEISIAFLSHAKSPEELKALSGTLKAFGISDKAIKAAVKQVSGKWEKAKEEAPHEPER